MKKDERVFKDFKLDGVVTAGKVKPGTLFVHKEVAVGDYYAYKFTRNGIMYWCDEIGIITDLRHIMLLEALVSRKADEQNDKKKG